MFDMKRLSRTEEGPVDVLRSKCGARVSGANIEHKIMHSQRKMYYSFQKITILELNIKKNGLTTKKTLKIFGKP